jgi:hypothetical protein
LKRIVLSSNLWCLLLWLSPGIRGQQLTPTLDTAARNRVDTLPLSDIDIPVRINLKALYRVAEKKVDTVFQSPGWPADYYQPTCDTRYMYRLRRGPLRIVAAGNTMQMKFTGYYQIKASQRLCTGGAGYTPWTPPCGCGAGAEGLRRVDMGFTANVALRPDYTLQARVNRFPTVPLDQCTVCFWGQNITSEVISAINAQMDTAGTTLQDTLVRLNLRPQFQQLWQKLWATYRLYNVGYFQLQPVRLRISNMAAHSDTLYLSVGISGRPLISLTPLKDSITSMPELSDFTPRHGFNIYLDARLNYDSLAAVLNTQLDHQTFTIDNRNVTVEKCALSALDQGHLQIGITFSGSGNGTFYLSGQPVLDTAKGVLEITDLDFHLQTNNVLMRTAGWLFDKKILKALRDYTRFPVNDYLEKIRAKANEQLSQSFISGIHSQGGLDRISILSLSVGASDLRLRCRATGELMVSVNDLSW